MTSILVIDDDPEIIQVITRMLQAEGYTTQAALSGEEGLAKIASQTPDMVILDVMMPSIDGLEVCRQLRADARFTTLPILMLTARGRTQDITQGLDTGADDYLVKPFEVPQLPARVRALLRRINRSVLQSDPEYLAAGGMRLALHRAEVEINGRVIDLTPTEHRLLHHLMARAGHPVPTEKLLEEVWEYPPNIGDPKLVRVHMVHLRNKIEPNPDKPQLIINVRGRGYMVNS